MTTEWDEGNLATFKPLLSGRRCFQISANPDSHAEVELYAKSKGIKYIISTNPAVLRAATNYDTFQGRESIDNWAGSLWERGEITYLFINPLKQLYSVPYGRYIAERFVSKITKPELWKKTPSFSWEPARTDTVHRWYELFSRSILITEDIETRNWDDDPENTLRGERHTTIRSVAYTGLWEDGNIHTIVLPIHDAPISELPFWLSWMRKFNALRISKGFQNGLYDCWHMVQYHAPVTAYLWDTQSLFHSWQAELPKDLAFIAAFLVHNIFYWKDMAKSANQLKQWEYNARDGWATMVSLLALLEEIPEWTIKNHLLKFPLWVPCLDCNLEGILCDDKARATLLAKNVNEHQQSESRLQKWFGEGFNPRSPQQVLKLIHFYGSPDIGSTEEPDLRKFAARHPLNNHYVNEILRNRGISKRISTYLKPADYSVTKKPNKKKKDPLLKRGRIYYGLNPDGTDNARLSCKEGASWTGMQIQNQERDATESVKQMMVGDPGWRLFDLDNQKSEAYTAAYTSGSLSYIETLRMDREEGKDFHRMNGCKFFGLKYEDVPQDLRDDACKRVIYGAGYNMQEEQLVRIMGELAVDKAKHLLGLPSFYTRKQVAAILLDGYDKAYPEVRGPNYTFIKNMVMSTHKLVSAIGWTRYCHGNPSKNKQDFNAYMAHVPSNLSVGILNEGLKDGYWKIRVKNPQNIRFKAQIHDSILGQVRAGYEHLVAELRDVMQRKIPVRDINGITRIMEIPVSAKISPIGGSWAEMRKFDINNLPQKELKENVPIIV